MSSTLLCYVARGDGENTAAVADAVQNALRKPGAVVLIPTETVYGLICNAGDAEAVRKIYALKDRAESKPLSWFVADWRTLDRYGVRTDGLPARLAERFCPGAITIIAPADDGSTIGFRIPDHPLVLEILRRVKTPLASTSANRSGSPNALTVTEALDELHGDVDLAVDGGAIPRDAQASTVVDATGEKARILRQGPLIIPAEF